MFIIYQITSKKRLFANRITFSNVYERVVANNMYKGVENGIKKAIRKKNTGIAT